MSHQVDPLAQYYAEDEEESSQPMSKAPVLQQADDSDPLAGYYEESEDQYLDTVAQDQKKAGYEPDAFDVGNEFERAAEFGTAEATRGVISGATAGFSEHVPGLKTGNNIAANTGKFVGSFAPIIGATKILNPATKSLASKSPVLQKQAEALLNLTGTFALGGTYGSLTEANENKRSPSVNDFINHGSSWLLLDGALQATGGAYRFTKSLLSTAKETKQAPWKVINETINTMRQEGVDFANPERVQAKAMSILEEQEVIKAAKGETRSVNQPQKEYVENLQKRVDELQNTKVSPKTLEPLKDVSELAEPYIPNEFDAVKVIEDSENAILKNKIENVGESAGTNKQLGENIRANVESQMKLARGETDAAYQLARENAQHIYYSPRLAATEGGNTLRDLEGHHHAQSNIQTQPSGYSPTIKAVQTFLEDAGFVVNRGPNGAVELIIAETEPTVDRLIQLAQRLNKMIKYDKIDFQIKDRLKPLVAEIKQDIHNALSRNDPAALEMWNAAEEGYAKDATRFNRPFVRAARQSKEGEKLINSLRSGTALQDIKNTVTPRQFQEIERDILDHLNTLKEDKAQALLKEVRPYLNQEAKIVADEVVASKAPKSKTSYRQQQFNKINDVVFNDLSNATLTGQRPDKTLKLWKSKEGQQLVKNALKDSPNKKEILDYVEQQSFYDFTSSFLEADGKIDFKKLNMLMKDPATIENIRLLGGEEAVSFFKNLENMSKELQNNLESLEKFTAEKQTVSKNILGEKTGKEAKDAKQAIEAATQRGQAKLEKGAAKQFPIQSFVNRYIKNMSSSTKFLFGAFGLLNPVLTAKAAVGYKAFVQLANSQKLRTLFRRASGKKLNPRAFFPALEAIDQELKD